MGTPDCSRDVGERPHVEHASASPHQLRRHRHGWRDRTHADVTPPRCSPAPGSTITWPRSSPVDRAFIRKSASMSQRHSTPAPSGTASIPPTSPHCEIARAEVDSATASRQQSSAATPARTSPLPRHNARRTTSSTTGSEAPHALLGQALHNEVSSPRPPNSSDGQSDTPVSASRFQTPGRGRFRFFPRHPQRRQGRDSCDQLAPAPRTRSAS